MPECGIPYRLWPWIVTAPPFLAYPFVKFHCRAPMTWFRKHFHQRLHHACCAADYDRTSTRIGGIAGWRCCKLLARFRKLRRVAFTALAYGLYVRKARRSIEMIGPRPAIASGTRRPWICTPRIGVTVIFPLGCLHAPPPNLKRASCLQRPPHGCSAVRYSFILNRIALLQLLAVCKSRFRSVLRGALRRRTRLLLLARLTCR